VRGQAGTNNVNERPVCGGVEVSYRESVRGEASRMIRGLLASVIDCFRISLGGDKSAASGGDGGGTENRDRR